MKMLPSASWSPPISQWLVRSKRTNETPTLFPWNSFAALELPAMVRLGCEPA